MVPETDREDVRVGPRRARGALVCALALVLWCGAGGCSRRPASRVLHVHAASSLADAFRDMEPVFEAAHPGVDVRLTFAGSQTLRLQIEQGARADVFASANPAHMRALVAKGMAHQPALLAANQLALIVPADNPARLRALSDLDRARRIVLGVEAVPIGQYTHALLQRAAKARGADGEAWRARVLSRVVSYERNVRLVRARVALGEADAAIVYRSDVPDASTQLRALPIPEASQVRAEVLIGVMKRAREPALARAWVQLARGAKGQEVLRARGFVVSARAPGVQGVKKRGQP